MSLHLAQALQRLQEWEAHHTPRVPEPVTSAALHIRGAELRIARAITDIAGSMTFVYLHVGWFGVWVALNSGILPVIGLVPWDPFPFGLLTLIVSLEAIFLSTFVMIAQNRLSALADLRAQADYEVNVRAEAEVAKVLVLVQALVEHHAAEGKSQPGAPAIP